jgi:TetR/AcrR family transcriptional regulator, mexJK operon transcriptional repressor
LPPRDKSDFENRRQQIIDGALHVFATKGFENATNKDIARAAKIGSPGLIYHYFKDKADLFRQVMQERTPVLYLFDHHDEFMAMPPREALTLFATSLLEGLDNLTALPMFKLMLGEAVRRPSVAQMFNKIGPGRGFAFMTEYLTRQMDAGTLRRMDPGAATRCFIGPIIAYMLTREVFVQPDARTLSAKVMAETLVDVFLQGMQVTEAPK